MKFCPFVKGECRKDCVFKCSNTIIDDAFNESDCLIAVKLSAINETQHSDLMDIVDEMKSSSS